MIETVIEAAVTSAMTASGGNPAQVAVGGVAVVYLRRASKDASKAIRLLQGEEDVPDKGVVERVQEHAAQLEEAARERMQLRQRISQLETGNKGGEI